MITMKMSTRALGGLDLLSDLDLSFLTPDFFDFGADLEQVLDATDQFSGAPDTLSATGASWTQTVDIDAVPTPVTLTVDTDGLGPVDDWETLEAALEAGMAEGTLLGAQISFPRGGETVVPLRLELSDTAVRLVSGDQALSVEGAFPSGLQPLFDGLEALPRLLELPTLPPAEAEPLLEQLNLLSIERLSLSDADVPLLSLSVSATEIGLVLGGLSASLFGTFPTGPAGDAIGTVLEPLVALLGGADVDLGDYPEVAINGLRVSLDGETLVDAEGEVGSLSALALGRVRINGTPEADVADMALVEGADDIVLRSFGGDDSITGTSGAETVIAGPGSDTVQALGGRDDLWGRGGADVLEGMNGNDRLYGNAGDDMLDGGAKRDLLFGGGGDDMVKGGKGNDVLRGGGGEDAFVLMRGDGQDVAKDYVDGIDRLILDEALWLDRFGALEPDEVVDRFGAVVDGDAVLRFSARTALTVEGVTDLTQLYDSIDYASV